MFEKCEIKTSAIFSCGVFTIDWMARRFNMEGITGCSDQAMTPEQVWEEMQKSAGKDQERYAVVVFAINDDVNNPQLALYELEEFEKEVYGPTVGDESVTSVTNQTTASSSTLSRSQQYRFASPTP